MPAPAIDRQRVALIAVAITSAGLAALSLRILGAAEVTAAKPIPAADVQSLSAYLAPLADTTSLAVSGNGTMVGEQDPFGSPARVVRVPANGASAVTVPLGTSQRWVVSSILFQGSKRSAIVNNSWVSVGDLLAGGARVTAIERKYVVVTDAQGSRQVVSIQDGRHEN
jgi:hypothetical protein